MKNRPRIKIIKNFTDYFLEIIAIIGLVSLLLLPVYFYNDLPLQLPKHFNAAGEVDAYGDRNNICVASLCWSYFVYLFDFSGKIPIRLQLSCQSYRQECRKII